MRRGDTARIIGIVALCLFVCAAAFAQPQKSKQYLVTVWVFQPRLKRMPSQDEISQSSMKFTLLRNADKMSPAPSDSDLLKQLRSLNPHLVFEKLVQKISQKIPADTLWRVPLKTESRMTLKIYDRERDKGVAQHRPPKGKERDWYLQFIKDKALVDVEVKRGGATFTSFVPIKQSVPYLATNSLDLEGASHRGQFHASVVGSDIIALTLKPLP